jgi:hypothetical protein
MSTSEIKLDVNNVYMHLLKYNDFDIAKRILSIKIGAEKLG